MTLPTLALYFILPSRSRERHTVVRGPRADAPHTVHHVMLRGIERRRIFVDTRDYEAFIERIARLIPELGFRCFAWALMPNHVHLALQTGHVPLARLMARLGTGYARYFNRRHRRVGHLFQNRFKSRIVLDDADLLGLVLYIHRNPLAAGLVASSTALAKFPWCGHGALLGELPARAFEDTAASLRIFADDPGEARRLVRLWMNAPPTRCDELASPIERPAVVKTEASPRAADLNRLIQEVCDVHQLAPSDLGPGRRSRRVVAARAEIACRATGELGLAGRAVAQALGVSDSTISRALAANQPSGKKR